MIGKLSNDYRPAIIGVGVFLVFGCMMTALAGTMLIWPGTRLDTLWALNESAHEELQNSGSHIGPVFWVLTIVFGAAAIGWLRQRVWGFRLTAAVLCMQVVGDLVNLARSDLLRGVAGVLIAG